VIDFSLHIFIYVCVNDLCPFNNYLNRGCMQGLDTLLSVHSLDLLLLARI
jgi:hypothetical protein